MPAPKPLTSGWAAILKGKSEDGAAEDGDKKPAAESAAASPKSKEGKQQQQPGIDKRPKGMASIPPTDATAEKGGADKEEGSQADATAPAAGEAAASKPADAPAKPKEVGTAVWCAIGTGSPVLRAVHAAA